MSKNKSPDLTDLFRKVPKVDSPIRLDQKILNEARRLAPARQRFFDQGWMPVTATVCVIGLAIVIARPILFDIEQPQPMTSEIESLGVSKERQYLDESTEPAAPIPQAMEMDDFTQAELQSNNENKLMAIESAQRKAEEAKASGEERAKRDQAKKIAKQKSDVVYKMESEILFSDEDIESQDSAVSGLRESSVVEETPMAAAVSAPTQSQPVELIQQITASEIAEAITKIKNLAQAGRVEEAKKLLEDLIQRCPDCQIPNSLYELQNQSSETLD